MPDVSALLATAASEGEKELQLSAYGVTTSIRNIDPCMAATRKVIASCSYPVQGKCCGVLSVPNGCSLGWLQTMLYHVAKARQSYTCDSRRWCPFDESITTCPCYQEECANLLSTGSLDAACVASIHAHCTYAPGDLGCKWLNITSCPANTFYDCATLATTSSIVVDGMHNYTMLGNHHMRQTYIQKEAFDWAQEYGCVTGARANPLPAPCPCASASMVWGNEYEIRLKPCSFSYSPLFIADTNPTNVASVTVMVVFFLFFYVADFLMGIRGNFFGVKAKVR